jgi:hypothetical protein
VTDGIRARLVSEGPTAEELIERLGDHRPAWDELRALLLDPESYQRPDRLVGRGTMPRERTPRPAGGYDVHTWGDDPVGYLVHLRVRRTKSRLRLTSRRPKPPALRDEIHDRVVEVDAHYVMQGERRRKLVEL